MAFVRSLAAVCALALAAPVVAAQGGAGTLTGFVGDSRSGDLIRQDQTFGGRTLTTTATYDDAGRRLSLTDPLDHTKRWTYDDKGNVLTEPSTYYVAFRAPPPAKPGDKPKDKDDHLADKTLVAASSGAWGQHLGYRTDTDGVTDNAVRRFITPGSGLTTADFFNLTVFFTQDDGKDATESIPLASNNPKAGARYLGNLLPLTSKFVRLAVTDAEALESAVRQVRELSGPDGRG